MKKSRIFSALLVLALLSTCVIGGTFAKYVKSGTGSDTARVAKFGVEITANGAAFAKEYVAHDSATTIAKTVVSTDNVVAPGTSGALTASTISGTPEVAVRVTREATLTLANWTNEAGNFYCPIVITVAGTPLCGLDYSSAADFKAAVEAAIAADSNDYAPGTDLSTASASTVTWAWDFSGRTALAINQTDADDTYLGNAATAATIAIEVVSTVTQID